MGWLGGWCWLTGGEGRGRQVEGGWCGPVRRSEGGVGWVEGRWCGSGRRRVVWVG